MLDKKWAIIDKLGGHWPDINEKPKWMHWKMFHRLIDQMKALDDAILWGGFAKYGC